MKQLLKATTPPVTKKSDPIRTCVGCRQRHAAQVLIRVRLHGESLVIEGAHPKIEPNGRGAWLCRETARSCIQSAVDSRAFDRAFRRGVPRDAIDAFVAGFPAADIV